MPDEQYRARRVRQLREDELIARSLHTWYGDVLATVIRWWRKTVLLDHEPL